MVDFFCYLYGMLRCSLIFLSGFTSREYLIASVDFIVALRGQIRKLRFALVVCIVFSNGEYHIVCVDFIGSSRGRLKRDRGFANPLSLSNTSPDPWGDPLRRGISAAAVDRDIDSLYPVQTVCLHFDMVFGCFVFGLGLFAFQEISLGIGSFVFHWWWIDCSCLRLRDVLL